MSSDYELMEIKNGWLARGQRPRMAGWGRTPEAAIEDWYKAKRAFEEALRATTQSGVLTDE